MSIRLTPDEAWDVLGRAHTGILTTLRADGAPVTLPVWFVMLDRAICFQTPARAKKVARIRRDPRAYGRVARRAALVRTCRPATRAPR